MPDQLATAEPVLCPIDSLAAGYEDVHVPVAVLLDNVRSMYNVGAFSRVADGVDLEKLCLCGITAHPPKKAISKTALGAEESFPGNMTSRTPHKGEFKQDGVRSHPFPKRHSALKFVAFDRSSKIPAQLLYRVSRSKVPEEDGGDYHASTNGSY